jgi:hypothetical protein
VKDFAYGYSLITFFARQSSAPEPEGVLQSVCHPYDPVTAPCA